jgi:hypothetical protein
MNFACKIDVNYNEEKEVDRNLTIANFKEEKREDEDEEIQITT